MKQQCGAQISCHVRLGGDEMRKSVSRFARPEEANGEGIQTLKKKSSHLSI
jgi:hypothetical protein